MRFFKLNILWFFLLITQFINANCNQVAITKVYDLMAKRATYLQAVAANKFLNNGNVYDANQELKVLTNAEMLAAKLHFESASLMQFAQIQMDLSKQIEQYWIVNWQQNKLPKPDKANIPNLTLLRQQIKAVDKELYPALKVAIPSFAVCDNTTTKALFAKSFVSIQGLPKKPDYTSLVIYSTKNIKFYP